jgi:hypothetical protein
MLRVSNSQWVVLNNNKLKAAAKNVATMAAAEATVGAAIDLTLVEATMTAVTTTMAMMTLTVTAAMTNYTLIAIFEIIIPSKSRSVAVFICSARCSNKVPS